MIKEQPPVAKTSKTETAAVESTAPSGIIKTSSTNSRNSSYPDQGVEVATSTRSLQVPCSDQYTLIRW